MATRIRDLADAATKTAAQLAKRIAITPKPDSPPGLIEALTVDPWSKSGKYGMGWTYFALALMGTVLFMRSWHFWQDKIRQAIYKQEVEEYYANLYNTDPDYAHAVHTGQAQHFFPDSEGLGEKQFKPRAHFSSVGFVNDTLALFRWVFYRPIPDFVWGSHRFTFSSLAVVTCGLIALAFVTLYCFLQQPLYWQSIQFGSPPIAIRAGMIAVALTPWIIVTSMKANVLSILIGIGPERLNVFHRWAGYLCLFLSLVHTIPFYVQPVWDDGGMDVFSRLFPGGSGVIYGTGIACLVPLVWLCVASLPFIRRVAYELFVMLHVPVGMVYVGLLFWHTKNYLASWDYLWATVGIWVLCYAIRLINLNWTRPWRLSFMVGDEAAISLLAENAIKITIPTQMRWKPGQYVYLRMPGVAFFDNHPFTISSLCSEDFPSEYGEQYRDCVLVFKPYGGFTRKVLDMAIERGPFHTYRAFLDGPYGGMRRDLAAFDTCILIAGGSGITALMSQLLNLIKRMRDGKAITRKVVVVWALKRLEAMDWFREELRICRESAPPESVTCKFFVTSAVRNRAMMMAGHDRPAPRALSHMFHDKLDGFVAGIASKRNSALIQSVAQGDPDREQELRAEQEDRITALPQQKYLQPHQYPPPPPGPPPSNRFSAQEESLRKLEGREYDEEEERDSKKREFHFPPINTKGEVPHFNYAPASPRKIPETSPRNSDVPIRPPELAHLRTTNLPSAGQTRPTSTFGPPSGFDFGFPETPTEFQKSLMRFAFPVPHQIDGGWSVEYGRPDLGYMLKEWATGGADGRGILGRRTAVFVCGPPAMRVGVANTVARLQAAIWGDDMLEEIYLHTENYAL
ncbi:ferric reductase like transmembrane component [Colletotrichum abscissum]|uniref:ferric-chelate reductase (NADPH) n=2 Tax=Colletotrichum acutatum species complex TaxID=2707335 RepID=A0A9P9XNN0_9PEZI|nr:ferric reductase like transmembrane component [Colletotrichum abscissum]KAI3535205.1 ferric reductase like transmembrane component [Colletotrichum filicis]KAI3557470.1 ferric reductase like transmembrane component [Colletotrichum abscissum]KAK1471686.1 ferric reductase like transmembrane component [Colletotrichum abscissum]KAK1494308.1 ferric reductase like transmembrane component [Colletotrichum cuscutae]